MERKQSGRRKDKENTKQSAKWRDHSSNHSGMGDGAHRSGIERSGIDKIGVVTRGFIKSGIVRSSIVVAVDNQIAGISGSWQETSVD